MNPAFFLYTNITWCILNTWQKMANQDEMLQEAWQIILSHDQCSSWKIQTSSWRTNPPVSVYKLNASVCLFCNESKIVNLWHNTFYMSVNTTYIICSNNLAQKFPRFIKWTTSCCSSKKIHSHIQAMFSKSNAHCKLSTKRSEWNVITYDTHHVST